MIEIIISAIIVPLMGALIYVLKSQVDNNKEIAIALNKLRYEIRKLSASVAYCPTNKKNWEKIKKQFGDA